MLTFCCLSSVDLAPHTTLAKAGRDYAHNCFTLDGVNLTPNNYLGISGLASGNTEPDTIDIYAMDVFEVLEAVSSSSLESSAVFESIR